MTVTSPQIKVLQHRKLFTLTLLISLSISCVKAQYQDRYWIMGLANNPVNTSNVTFDFYPNSLSIYDITGPPPAMNPAPNNITSSNGFEGWGVVTNPETGELLFYTDGEDVFDFNHQDITPSGGLGASASSAQAVAIAVKPVCPFDQYYIFSNPTGVFGGGNTSGPVTYRIYTIGGGFSPLTALPGPDGTAAVGEGMLMIPSKTTPYTFWLVVRLLEPSLSGSNYVVYKIDPTGISHHETFTFGPTVTDNPYSPIMNMTYIDDGSMDNVLVGFSVSGTPNRVFVNRFNATSGIFESIATELDNFNEGTLYDVEFSPSGNFLYYASYFPSILYQVPVNGGTPKQLRNFGALRGGGLKRAPDGFIYHIYDAGVITATDEVRIGRIVQPDIAYNGSNFNAIYQADFNSSVSIVYDNVFAYNFPEFAGVPNWSAELAIIGENPVCTGADVQISTTINTLGQAIENYQWLFNGDDFITTTDPSLTIDQAGQYQVLINVEGGCIIASNQITIELAINPPQIDNIITSPSSCGTSNGSITIEASGGEGTLAYFLDGTISSTGNILGNLSPGFHIITVQDQGGCTVSQEVEIMQSEPGPLIESVELVQPTCLSNDGAISIQANGITANLEYALNDLDYQLSNQFMGLLAGPYTVLVRDENDCLSTTTVELTEIDNGPQIIEIISQPTGCFGNNGSISISAIAPNGGLSYSIDGVNFKPEGEFSGLSTGTYNIIIQDGLGCTTSEEVIINAEEALPLIESIQLDRPICSSSDGMITVSAQTENEPLTYSIDGVNFQLSNIFNNLIKGTYTLYLQDAAGCSIDSTILLLDNNCPIYLPNVFSPNDDGINARFQLFSKGESPSLILRYHIYDRWGEQIYEVSNFLSTEYNLFWDGTFREQKMSAGIYVYVLEVGYEDGETLLLTGDVLLLR